MTPVLATSAYVVAMTFLAGVVIIAMTTIGAGLVVSWWRSRSDSESLKAKLAGEMTSEDVLAAIQDTPVRILASDKDVRKRVFEALQKVSTPPPAGSASRIVPPPPSGTINEDRALSDSAYATIISTLTDLPDTIPETEKNPPQKVSLEMLARTFGPLPEPFRFWSNSFRTAADTLAKVLPMNSKLDALLNTALRAKAHFDIDFHNALNAVRESAQDRDTPGCSQAIKKMKDSVVSWVNLTSDWYSLREDAAAHMRYVVDGDNEKWSDLRHVAVNFAEPDSGRPMVWWQSGLLSRSDSLERLSTWIFREIDDRIRDGRWKEKDFEAVCSMSSTGVPLATLLSSHYHKRLVIVDEGADFRFPPGFEPYVGDNILLVDSNISTGGHLFRCAREINEAGASIMAAVFICENDLSPSEKRLPIVETARSKGQLIRLFTLGDIYNRWTEARALTEMRGG